MSHRFARGTICAVAWLALCAAPERAHSQDEEGPVEMLVSDLDDDAESLARREQTDAILEEAASLPAHAWAGDYFLGDGLGRNISMALAPRGGVTASLSGCMGTYAADAGAIEIRDDGTLQLRLASSSDDADAFPRQLVPVAWGERRYLIDPSEMLAFVNAINLGDEPRSNAQGRFLLARSDETRPAHGLPALPARWLPLIRSEAVDVRVTAIEPQPAVRTEYACVLPYRLTLDHGKDIGLVPGSALELTSPGYTFATIEVIEVGNVAAVATLEVHGTDCATGRELPAIGWVFSTGALGWSLFDDDTAAP